MVGLVTFDFVLRLVLAGTRDVAFELDLRSDHFDDRASDATGFRIPTHVIANFESSFHGRAYFPKWISQIVESYVCQKLVEVVAKPLLWVSPVQSTV